MMKKSGERTILENVSDSLNMPLALSGEWEIITSLNCCIKNIRDKLLDTGDAYLVECAHLDKAWACGRGLDEEERFDASLWKGSNILGFALMEVRNMIRSEYGQE